MRPPSHPTVTYANEPKGAGASRASSSPAPSTGPHPRRPWAPTRERVENRGLGEMHVEPGGEK